MTLRLLVASHSKTLQRVLDIALSQQDVAMVTVASRTDALVAVGRHPFDATLIDADLPQAEGGYGLCRELRARATGSLPAVLMTSQEHPFDLAKAQQVGGAVGLAKPFATQALVLAVRQAVAESRPADGADAGADTAAAAAPAPDARAQHMAAIDEALAALADDRPAAAAGPAAAPLSPPTTSAPAFIRLDTGAEEGPVQLPAAKARAKPFFDDESTASRPFARGAAPVTVVRRPSNALRAQSRLDAPLPSVDSLPALPDWGTPAAEPPPAESAVPAMPPAPPRPQASPASHAAQAAPPPPPPSTAAAAGGPPTPSLSMAAARAASMAALAELRHQSGSEPPAGAHAALEGPLSRAIERQLAQILSQVVPGLVAQEIRRHLEPPPLPPGHGRSAEAPADAGD